MIINGLVFAAFAGLFSWGVHGQSKTWGGFGIFDKDVDKKVNHREVYLIAYRSLYILPVIAFLLGVFFDQIYIRYLLGLALCINIVLYFSLTYYSIDWPRKK